MKYLDNFEFFRVSLIRIPISVTMKDLEEFGVLGVSLRGFLALQGGKHEGFDIALRIRIGFWGPVYYNVNKLFGGFL